MGGDLAIYLHGMSMKQRLKIVDTWRQFRVWVHRLLRHRPISCMPVSDLVILTACSCGGHVQSRWEGSAWAAEYATCPIGRARLNKLPLAVVHKETNSPLEVCQ